MAVTLSTQDRDAPTDVARLSSRSNKLQVCAECAYAQLFAVQPRAVCTCEGSDSRGKILFTGQPARTDMSPRAGEELVLSLYSSGLKRARPLFASAPPRMH